LSEHTIPIGDVQFQALIENALDVFAVLDPKGGIQYVSPCGRFWPSGFGQNLSSSSYAEELLHLLQQRTRTEGHGEVAVGPGLHRLLPVEILGQGSEDNDPVDSSTRTLLILALILGQVSANGALWKNTKTIEMGAWLRSDLPSV